MKSSLLFILLFSGSLLAQNLNYGLRIGGSGSDFARFTVTDKYNNFYVYGTFNNTITFDSAGTPVTLTSAGQRDFFLVKYNCNKVQQWRVRVGGAGNEGGLFVGFGIFVSEKTDDIFISGSLAVGSCNFISSNGVNFTTRTSAGNSDIYTAKLNNNGIFQWVANHGSSGWDEAGSLCIDDDDNVYTTGYFSNTCTFRAATGSNTIVRTSAGSDDVFVIKQDKNGNLLYVATGGSNRQDMGTNVRADKFGNVYLTGIFSCCGSGTATFGSLNVSNINSWGGFITKINSSGQFLWINHMGAAADEALINLEIDHETNSIYAIGHYNGNTTLTSQPPGNAVALTTNGNSDVLVCKFNQNGSLIWANNYGGTGADIGWGIDIDKDGNPVIGNDFQNTFQFGPVTLNATGSNSTFVGRVDKNNGAPISGSVISGNGSTFCRGLSMNNSGLIYVTGYFTLTTNVGPTALVSAGQEDVYVASYILPDTTILKANKTAVTCSNDSVKLFVENKQGKQFKWYRNNMFISTTDSNFIYINAPGSYFVINTNNCVPDDTSNTIVVTLNNTLTVSAGLDKLLCRGDSIQLNINTNIGSKVKWIPATGLSNDTIRNPFVKLNNTQNYVIEARLGSCFAYDTIAVIVKGIQVNAGDNKGICLGDSVQLTASTTGNNIVWRPAGLLNDSLTLTPFVKPTATQYFYLFGLDSSCISVDSALVQVSNISVNAGTAATVCAGDSITLAGSTNATQFNWLPGNINTLTPKIKADTTRFWYLTANENGCVKTDSILIKPILLIVDAGNAINLCKGDTAVFNSNVSGGNFVWFPAIDLNDSTLLQPTVKPYNSRWYYLKADTANCIFTDSVFVYTGELNFSINLSQHICQGDSITLNATTNASQIIWQPGNINSLSPKVSPQTPTWFYASASLGSCVYADSTFVDVTAISADAGTEKNICAGDTIVLNASYIGNSFNWWPNYRINNTAAINPLVWPNSDTSYVLTVLSNTCIKTDTVRVKVNQSVNLITYGNQSICIGDTIQLLASGANQYEWIPNYNINNTNSNNPFVFPHVDTAYIVKGLIGNCNATDTLRIKVNQYPIVDAGVSVKYCINNSTELNGMVSGANNFVWRPSNDLSDSTLLNPVVSSNASQVYYLYAFNGNCVSVDSTSVFVSQGVNAAFSYNPTEGLAPLLVNFNNQSSNNATSFLWQFGEGSSNNDFNTQHVYNDSGLFKVMLIVTDSAGCVDTAYNFIKVFIDGDIYIPNVFTPNGDLLNEFFRPVFVPELFEFVRLTTYTRWGQLIHDTTMPGGSWWDGTYNGNFCQTGVYFYLLEAKSKLGKTYNMRGTVTLLR